MNRPIPNPDDLRAATKQDVIDLVESLACLQAETTTQTTDLKTSVLGGYLAGPSPRQVRITIEEWPDDQW